MDFTFKAALFFVAAGAFIKDSVIRGVIAVGLVDKAWPWWRLLIEFVAPMVVVLAAWGAWLFFRGGARWLRDWWRKA